MPITRDYTRSIKALDAKFRQRYSILTAIADEMELLPIQHTRRYLSNARQWGALIQKANNLHVSINNNTVDADAYMYGSAAGLAVTAHVHGGSVSGNDMVETFHGVRLSPLREEDDHQRQTADDLVELSDLGILAMGNTSRDIVDSWGSACTQGYSKQLLFRRGVGMAAFLAYHAHAHRITTEGGDTSTSVI